MSDLQRPDHALLLDLSEILRRFGDRQRELLTVVRHLRLGETADLPPASSMDRAEPDGEPVLSPATVMHPPAPVPRETLTLTTTRDYDYFEELDVRLSRLRQDENSGPL
jgi:hypothetical protein